MQATAGSGRGKPPKSAAAIQATLQSVHANNDPPVSGSSVGGLAGGEQIVLAQFHDATTAYRLQRWLSEAGIGFSVASKRRLVVISVDAEDRVRAAELLGELRREHPEPARPRIRRAYDLLTFGLALGGALGLTMGVGVSSSAKLAAALVAFTAAGGLIGLLLDRIRASIARSGSKRLGLSEFLILMTLPAVLLSLLKLAELLIRTP